MNLSIIYKNSLCLSFSFCCVVLSLLNLLIISPCLQPRMSNSNKQDVTFKVIIIGDIHIGKTSLFARCIGAPFPEGVPTIGSDYVRCPSHHIIYLYLY